MNQYYYLISSLPELDAKAEKFSFSTDAIIETIMQNLSENDKALFSYIILSNDNSNLLTAIARRQGSVNESFFSQPSLYSEQEIAGYLQNSDILPAYMRQILEQPGFINDNSLLTIEHKINEGFYNEVLNTGDDFLVKFFTFELNLRKIFTAYNSRKFKLKIEKYIHGEDELSVHITRSSAGDFGLGNEYPYMLKMKEVVEGEAPERIEELFDEMLWQYADELTTFSYFNTHAVFAYGVKLMIIDRRRKLSAEAGKERLDKLMENIIKDFKIPELNN